MKTTVKTTWASTSQVWMFSQVLYCFIHIRCELIVHRATRQPYTWTHFFFFSSAKAKAYRLPPVLIVCLYCHPLLLSETGCVPPPTPTALLSITPGWQQTGNPSRPHSASYIALLEGTTSPAGCDELSSVYIERDTWYWCWVIKRDTGMPDWVGLDKKL